MVQVELVVDICRADMRATPGAIDEIINSKVKPPYFKNVWFHMRQQKLYGQEVERRRENVHIIEFLGS